MSKSAYEILRQDIKDGGITLVLGSGINGKFVPDWERLLEKVCGELDLPCQIDVLTTLRAFEQKRENDNAAFAEIIHNALYDDYTDSSLERAKSLKAIGDVLIKDRQLDIPKIRRVITFNVDSLLEEYLLKFSNKENDVVPHPITQWYQAAMHYKPGIDIYHLHGFMPSEHLKKFVEKKPIKQKYYESSKDVVFGDDEYWDMTSSPASLPNVVMLNALHDSHCIFIGLSMNDPNIARWLALRANEIKESKRIQPMGDDGTDNLLTRHYWFESDPASANKGSKSERCMKIKQFKLKKSWLKSRGVRTVELGNWEEFPDKFLSVFA
ncbi:MAG: SIR2 family protein [Kiritimatiellae bacterium]|nr:SIR2 family protein [Kiritimatiellia bacterium]